MTTQGVQELYMALSIGWPHVVRPGADEEWKRAKVRDLYRTFEAYPDEDVLEAVNKWKTEQEKYPTTKNIINEIEWLHVRRKAAQPQAGTYQMERIRDDGTEFVVSVGGKINFTWSEFLHLPGNPEHLGPEEWRRRFEARRKRILARLYSQNGGRK